MCRDHFLSGFYQMTTCRKSRGSGVLKAANDRASKNPPQ